MRLRSLRWAVGPVLAAIVWGCAGSPSPNRTVQIFGGESSTLRLPSLEGEPIPPARVVLLSISGLTPEAYRGAPGASPRMPELAVLARAGVSAEAVVPVVPAAIYPAHATLVTGEPPDQHGVVGDRLLGKRGVRAARYWHASRVHGVTLWQLAREADLGVAALGWPSTLGAAIDLLLPDVAPTRPGESWLSLLSDSTTPWLLSRVESSAPASGQRDWPQAFERDALIVDLACEIAESESPPELWLLHLSQAGEALTLHGPDSREVDQAFHRIDAELSRLVGCLRRRGLLDSSALVISGDRSLAPVHTQIDPNAALAKAGLIAREPPSTSTIRDWIAIALSHGGSAFVYAQDEPAALEARRVLQEEAERTRAFRIVSAAELQSLRGDPNAWFGLAAAPGFAFGNGIGGPVLRAASIRAAGGYLPGRETTQVGFVAWGRGIRRELRVPRVQQLDIGPTVAALLDLRFGSVDGRPMVGILEEAEAP